MASLGGDQDEIDDLEFQKMLDLMNSIERPQELKEMTSSVVVHANKEVKKKTKKTVNVPVPEKQEYVDPLEAWKGKLRVVFIVGEPESDSENLAREVSKMLGHNLITASKAIKDMINDEGLSESLKKDLSGNLSMTPPDVFRAVKHALRGVLDSHDVTMTGATELCFIIEGFPSTLALSQAFEAQIKTAQLLVYIKTFRGFKKMNSALPVVKTDNKRQGWGKKGGNSGGGFSAAAPSVNQAGGNGKGWGKKKRNGAKIPVNSFEEEAAKKRVETEKQRKLFRELTGEMRERYEKEGRLVTIWGGRRREEMMKDLLGLFDEVPVKVLVETKKKSKKVIIQHKSHKNDQVDKQGLVTSGIQANTSVHTFFRGGESETIPIPESMTPQRLVPPKESLEIDLLNWLKSLYLWNGPVVQDFRCWRRKFSNGYMMAELIESYFHPNVIDLHTFDKYANSTKNKVDNWNRIILVLRNLRYRFKKLEVNVDVNLLMNERKGSAVRVLRRFYTGLMRRGITPETKFLKLPKEKEEEVYEEEVAVASDKPPDFLNVALRKIKTALDSRMKPNIKAFQGRPLDMKEFKGLLKQELRVTLTGHELRETFKYFDQDNSGDIDYAEIIHKIYHKERLHVARPSGANRDGGNPSPKKRQIIDKKDKTIRKEWKGSLTSTKLDAVEISIVFEDGDNTEVLVGKMAEEEL